jgi:hypothetical protein
LRDTLLSSLSNNFIPDFIIKISLNRMNFIIKAHRAPFFFFVIKENSDLYPFPKGEVKGGTYYDQ